MKIVEFNKKLYTVPENWNELTAKQLIGAIKHTYTNDPSEYSIVRLFKLIIGASRWRVFWASADELSDKIYLLFFLLGENTLTENHIPQYRGLHGPKKNFENLIMSEFLFSEIYFMRFGELVTELQKTNEIFKKTELEKKADEQMNMLIATLYRPGKLFYNNKKDKDGDVREAFNDNKIVHSAKQIANWPRETKLAIHKWYEGCRKQLVKDFPKPFEGNGDGESSYGLWSVARGIAEKGTFGDFSTVEKQFVRTVMMELTESIIENERMKKLYKA